MEASSCLQFLIACLLFTPLLGLQGNFSVTTFNESFSPLFGGERLRLLDTEGTSVQISLDNYSGSGFISQQSYPHGYFSADIMLPANYSSGVVVAFYTSNERQFPKTHDELDFEFLGGVNGSNWILQTNMYGQGSKNRGREERFNLWFDPTQEFHSYGILWTGNWTVFYVDEFPIRVVKRVVEMGLDYPSKPMSVLGTIWDGSNWAKREGRPVIDYKYAPFSSKFSEFVLYGCSDDPTQPELLCQTRLNFNGLTSDESAQMALLRGQYMTYSYCQDRVRYPIPLPECVESN